jgi:hypothetical protein
MSKVRKIKIGGIVLATNSFEDADGQCEEMINVRHKANKIIPVGDKVIETAGVNYTKVFTHNFNDFENKIGVI